LLQVERISGLETRHAELLAQLPPHLQTHYWARHQQAAGANQEGGRWMFPPLILDEQAFREQLLGGECC
jgi:hypothetical protein